MPKSEKTRVMELTDGDVREIHQAVRDRSKELQKSSKRLRDLGCHAQADELDAKVADLNERLATQFAAELDAEGTDTK